MSATIDIDDMMKRAIGDAMSPATAAVNRVASFFPGWQPIAQVPTSEREKRAKAIQTVSKAHIITSEVLKALDAVSKIPGVVENARWTTIQGKTLRIHAELEGSDDISQQFIAAFHKEIESALERIAKQVALRSASSGQIANFIDRAKALESRGLSESALDLIYDAIDELLRRGQFALCDSVLSEINPADYSTDILLGILTATAPAKAHLHLRKQWFDKVKKTLKSRNEYERGILDGLD